MVKINKFFLYNSLCAITAIIALIWAKSNHKIVPTEPQIVKTFKLDQNELTEEPSLIFHRE